MMRLINKCLLGIMLITVVVNLKAQQSTNTIDLQTTNAEVQKQHNTSANYASGGNKTSYIYIPWYITDDGKGKSGYAYYPVFTGSLMPYNCMVIRAKTLQELANGFGGGDGFVDAGFMADEITRSAKVMGVKFRFLTEEELRILNQTVLATSTSKTQQRSGLKNVK